VGVTHPIIFLRKVLKFDREDVVFAKGLGKKLFLDLVHASVALKSHCEIICTWNVKDFKKVSRKLRVLKPSEL